MSRRKTTPAAPTPEQELALLRAQLASLSRDNEALAADNARLAAEASESAAAAAEAAARVGELEARVARLVELIKLANLRHFAPKSERVPDDQTCLSLFNDAEAWADPGEPEPELAGEPPARPRRRGGKRRIDTSGLERVVVEHDLEDRACPACGAEMSEMKVEVREVIRLVPAHLVVEEHRRHVYRCKACCDANAAGEEVASRIVRAPMPALTPIPRSFATASMLSWVINAKYANSMPYYRLERDFLTLGAEVSRQDMANWTIGAHERWLSLIHSRMRERLLECRYLNADETEVQVLREPGREARQKSYMWLFRTGPHELPICVFEYRPTRSGSVPRAFLEGWCGGYLTTDGYDPYFDLRIEGAAVTNTACLVHVRRKFAEIVRAAGGDDVCEDADSVALEARRRVDRIFRVDSKFDKLDPERRRKAREKKLRPLMESFGRWAASAVDEAVPGLALHKALCYALKYWPYVMNVLEDGRLGLDNNISERCIKSFVIGRKNFLFSDTPRGAEASAAIYSIVVTAKLNGLNQRAYLEWLLTEMPNDERLSEPGRIDRYLPWSDEVPSGCRLAAGGPDEADALPDEPIVDAEVLGDLPEGS